MLDITHFSKNKCDALIKDLMLWMQGFKLNCFPQQSSFTMNIGKMKYALKFDIISSRNKVNIAKVSTNLATIPLGKHFSHEELRCHHNIYIYIYTSIASLCEMVFFWKVAQLMRSQIIWWYFFGEGIRILESCTMDENMKNVFILSQEKTSFFKELGYHFNIYVLSSTISSHEMFSKFWMIDGKLWDLALFF